MGIEPTSKAWEGSDIDATRVPGVYLAIANLAALEAYAFNAINKLRASKSHLGPIPTPGTNQTYL
jgi:hypothetical protein